MGKTFFLLKIFNNNYLTLNNIYFSASFIVCCFGKRIFNTTTFFMQKFKQEVLVQYLYNKTSQDVTIAIEEALQENWELQDELNVLQRTMKQLDTLHLKSPRKSSINAILDYAKSKETITQD